MTTIVKISVEHLDRMHIGLGDEAQESLQTTLDLKVKEAIKVFQTDPKLANYLQYQHLINNKGYFIDVIFGVTDADA